MAVRNTLLKSEAGVRLELLERINAHGTVLKSEYRLRSLRPTKLPRLTDRAAAEDAYDLEVVGCLMDPIVQDMVKRGAAEFG
ncbi:hypothetical protein [uncultured Brevundimonas sp.]|uniref:hypothetical protein n=1 Tax=uncultured Brevundimonas sp. TaxID=213418 RepID=UPI0025F21F42|nr:hypothetical protein [uncultured Brevundimonas sp.]